MGEIESFRVRFYRLDGLLRAFELALRVFPPVFEADGEQNVALATDETGEPYWKDVRAESREELEVILRRSLTRWGGVQYMDADGRLLYFTGAPKKPFGIVIPHSLSILMPSSLALDVRMNAVPSTLSGVAQLIASRDEIEYVQWRYDRC
jgi:hypothetical protein